MKGGNGRLTGKKRGSFSVLRDKERHEVIRQRHEVPDYVLESAKIMEMRFVYMWEIIHQSRYKNVISILANQDKSFPSPQHAVPINNLFVAPLICSFITDKIMIDHYINTCAINMFPYDGEERKKEAAKILMKDLLSLNLEINETFQLYHPNLYNYIQQYLRADLIYDIDDNVITPKYQNTLLAIHFLSEVLGIYAKEDYISRGKYQLNDRNQIVEIDERYDDYCKDINNCDENICNLRRTSKGDFKCVSKSRHRTLHPGHCFKNACYFILEDNNIPLG